MKTHTLAERVAAYAPMDSATLIVPSKHCYVKQTLKRRMRARRRTGAPRIKRGSR